MNIQNIVSKFPIICSILLEFANIGQMIRMWSEWTAQGQSLISWMAVNLALILWFIFYIVKTPNEKWAIWCQGIGILINGGVIFSVIYFRYLL